jgi:hypothetical protein
MPEPLFTQTGPTQTTQNPVLQTIAESEKPQVRTPGISPEIQRVYTEISRRDAEVRKRELGLTAKEKQIKELEAKYGNLDKLKGDPEALLKTFNLTPDQILLAQLGKKPPSPKVEDQIKAIEEKIEADRKAREEEGVKSKSEQERQQIAWFRQNVANEVKQKADKYPLANALGMAGHIADEMGVYYEQYGEPPTVDMIAEAAESYVSEQLTKAGWVPPKGTQRSVQQRTGTSAAQGGQLFSAVDEVRHEPKNQDARAAKFSLDDRVKAAMGQVG